MPRQVPAALPLEAQWERAEKPLPQLPSPTLTNPDYILPSSLSQVTSPPRVTRRPPSPSYLRDKSDDNSRMAVMGKKEKLGLMSRKMLLMRSRTASGASVPVNGSQGDSDLIPSSPVLQDVGNLAPETPEYLQLPQIETDRRSASGGSSSSDISGMAAFLAKYEKKDGTSDDEAYLYENEEAQTTRPDEEQTEADSELSEERRKAQEDEYQSAILSKRAEQILANAKKRLNVMEGNLRGARELVAPLTAANLKRATSLGSAHYMPGHGHRYASNGHDYEESQQGDRMLHPQSSSPTMGRDYYSHARGFSETEVPERAHTALDYSYGGYHAMTRQLHSAEQRSPETGLRSTRSYDTLGGYGKGRERPLHAHPRDSPDSSLSGYLEPLQEADEHRRSLRNGHVQNNGLGIYRPSSRTSDIREQMNSLKGKISSLKERAREESLRRQSHASLRDASPLNNATAAAPEFFYTSSSGCGSPVLDTNAGVGRASTNSNSPASPHFPKTSLDSRAPGSGSRNAFAEQAAAQKQGGIQQARVVEVIAKPPTRKYNAQPKKDFTVDLPAGTIHRRTPSGTAIIESARNRYSHHQQQTSQDMPGAYVDDDEDETYLEVPSPGLPTGHQFKSFDSSGSSGSSSRTSPHIDDDPAPSEDGTSVYEDANEDAKDEASGIAHEDRADAFDYQNFFLHSAMGSYSNGRRGSTSSEDSADSTETAKGPAAANGEEEYLDDENFDHMAAQFPPPTPETPEKLREIEANLHKRSFSDESISTLATYATADEEHSDRGMSPPVLSPVTTPSYVPRPVSRPGSRPGSRPQTRPSTAVNRALPSDSSSDRADSGVGLPRRAIPAPGSMTPKPKKSVSNVTNTITPPTSPLGIAPKDPAAVAVQALLNAEGRPLGLRNKAVLFSVVESLRKVVGQLQELDETSYEARDLRGRLDEAKYMLDGRGGQ